MMIGWQLLPAALFIKLFGFSFTAARMSVLLVALTTAFLVQRTFVRAGVGEWNATLATLTFVLSPLFLPLSVCFMTDVPGTFAIVVCLYGCLRALQASTTGASAAWISFAALANAVGGTARQIAWLGVLVMVPCTVWLLRRQRRVVIAGTISVVTGIAIVAGSLQWFSQQPHINPEPSIFHSFSPALRLLFDQFRRLSLGVSFLVLPVSLAFILALRQSGRRAIAIAVVLLLACVGKGVQLYFFHALTPWSTPPFFTTGGNVISAAGIWESAPAFGERPEWLSPHGGIVMTAFALAALISAVSVIGFGNLKQYRDRRLEVSFVAKPARRLATIPVGLSVPADAKGYEHRTL